MNSKTFKMTNGYVEGSSANTDYWKPEFTEPSHYRMVVDDDNMSDFLEDLDSDEEIGSSGQCKIAEKVVVQTSMEGTAEIEIVNKDDVKAISVCISLLPAITNYIWRQVSNTTYSDTAAYMDTNEESMVDPCSDSEEFYLECSDDENDDEDQESESE